MADFKGALRVEVRHHPLAMHAHAFVPAGLARPAGATVPAAEESPPDPNRDIADLIDRGRHADAEALARGRLREVESRFGPDSAETADVLDLLVMSLWRLGKVKDGEALGLAGRAIRIRKTSAGTRPEDLARSLFRLAQVHAVRGEPQSALPLYERALALREQARGSDDPEVGRIVVSIGIEHARLGDYATARVHFERALEVARGTLPPGDPDLGFSLVNLANLDFLLADYEAARARYEEALGIWETAHGPAHPHVGAALGNLANVLFASGDYAASITTYRRAIAVDRQTLSGDHPDLAHKLHNFAEVLRATGQHDEARRILEEALAIQRRALAPENPRLATTLQNIAAVLIDERQYEAARDHLGQALALVEKAGGADHPDLINILSSLAFIHARVGEVEEAAPIVERARSLAAVHLPPDHPRVGELDVIESELRARRGDLAGARRLRGQALAARLGRLGPWHQKVVEVRSDLAGILWAQGERAAALGAAGEAAAALDRYLRDTMQVLPEARALQLASFRPHPERVLFAGLLEDPDRRPAWLAACWDWSLRNRGLVLEEISARRVVAALAGAPDAQAALARVTRASNRLAAVWTRGADPAQAATFAADIESARRARDEAETALAEASARFRRLRRFAPADARQVAAAIPEGSILIEIVRVSVRPGAAGEGSGAADATGPRYVALRLDREGRMDFADLGAAGTVDGLVGRWRLALRRMAEDGSEGQAARAGAPGEVDETARALGRAVWDRLARLAGGARRVFLVPDGTLHQVYFPALPLTDGRFLIEGGPTIHLLSTGRDLARTRDPVPARNAGTRLLALGGVLFSGPREAGDAPGSEGGRGAGSAGGMMPCPSLSEIAWPPLPESAREVARIAGLFEARGSILSLTGVDATETRLKREAPGSTVLHLATHGFFLDADCIRSAPNPLLLSGLVLSEAGPRRPPGGEDGLLTAEEIAALDLSSVGLTVLSACNTGLGQVKAGEGGFGLRRALEIAGSGSMVMSLWPIPDRQARRWMTSFYTAWLGGGPVDEAARRASLDRLADLRQRKRAPHPYLWGGFVTAGDWRPAVVRRMSQFQGQILDLTSPPRASRIEPCFAGPWPRSSGRRPAACLSSR